MILTYYQAIDLMSSLPIMVAVANNPVMQKDRVEESNDTLLTDVAPLYNFYEDEDIFHQDY